MLLWLVSAVQDSHERPLKTGWSEDILVPSHGLEPLSAYPLVPPDRNLLPTFPVNWNFAANNLLPGWRCRVSGRNLWDMGTVSHNGATWLGIILVDLRLFALESPLISLTGTQVQSVRMRGRVRRSEDFEGTVIFQLVTYSEKPDGTLEQVAVNGFEVRDTRGEEKDTFSINRKVELPKRVTHLRFRIETTFKGALYVEQPFLTAEQTARGKK